ncbi:uncharacterized protein [Gossypium hirsutum]|uniref:Uncharacterized protein isoform X2 n=1 Tax=Gossypium hirsutum TaxID=3635 RepID=A0ABM3A0C0_GOSHI|nr:uncharacterized protein LOC107947929 isoform X2 [Gossypium hirsutum]
MHLTYLISVPQVIYWNVGFYIIKNILKSTVQNAWQEEVERARQGQRDAESKLSSLEAKVQKMRVEMAAMKRDAEHYSRQVFQRRKMLRIDGLCKKMGYKDAKLLMLYGGRSSINRLISVSLT